MDLRVGIDIGSTTVKVVVLDENKKLLFRSYERHYSKTRERTLETLNSIRDLLSGRDIQVTITGSAGLGVANASGIDFVQEVYATAAAVNTYIPGTDAVIELGGEDAKIIFFGGALEERMNGSCAGGTGAFIDQMATLLDVTPEQLDTLATESRLLLADKGRCARILAVQTLKLFLMFTLPWFCIRFMGLSCGLSFWQVQLLTSLMLFLSNALPNVAGMGSIETAFLLVFSSFMTSGEAMSTLMLFRIASYYFVFAASAAGTFAAQKHLENS